MNMIIINVVIIILWFSVDENKTGTRNENLDMAIKLSNLFWSENINGNFYWKKNQSLKKKKNNLWVGRTTAENIRI